jgi:hypothetical protein
MDIATGLTKLVYKITKDTASNMIIVNFHRWLKLPALLHLYLSWLFETWWSSMVLLRASQGAG